MTFVESMVMLSVIMNFIMCVATTLLLVKLLTLNKVVKDVIALVSKSAANGLMNFRPPMPGTGTGKVITSEEVEDATNPLVG